jgi:flagellar biosynthetic protein FliP
MMVRAAASGIRRLITAASLTAMLWLLAPAAQAMPAVPSIGGTTQVALPSVDGSFTTPAPQPTGNIFTTPLNNLGLNNLGLNNPGTGNTASGQAPWTIIVLLTLLTLIPALMLSMTPFVRLLIVFHFLRQALGTQSTPTNQTLIGLALVLTFFLMQPVGLAIQQQAIAPLEAGTITPMAAVEIGSRPLKTFMLHYVREKDVALFLELAKQPRPRAPEDLSMRIVMPAYILSELKAGFQIGAVLFLPFLVIDMVVASITTSVGMMQLPPVVISTPLKLLLFVMVDGWNLLIGSLMRSFS